VWKYARTAAVLAGASVLVIGATRVSAASTTPPHIVVVPNDVMVNTMVALTGSGFAPNTNLTIRECGARTWVVTTQACDRTNAITVHTNGSGRFRRQIVVQVCPRLTPIIGPITEERCFIGHPTRSGVDTVTLVGAAPITVTYP
jgi:hypothetical protein